MDNYSLAAVNGWCCMYRCRLRSFASIAKNINPCQFEDENVRTKRQAGGAK